MLVSGLDEYVNALGGVAVGGGTVVVVQETQEVGKGFDLSAFGFLIADFFGFAFGVVVCDAKEGPVIGVADFEFHRNSNRTENWRDFAGGSSQTEVALAEIGIQFSFA